MSLISTKNFPLYNIMNYYNAKGLSLILNKNTNTDTTNTFRNINSANLSAKVT